MYNPFKRKNAALLMALASIYPLYAHGATGIAQFAVGDVNVRRGATTMPLNRGAQINSGDNIVTGRAGQTQIRFSDGGLVSLAPNSQFSIDRYVDVNKPEEDGFFASLLRGGMRAITGLVGKRNRESYKITTTTATIGIRGSAFSANYNPDGSLNVAGEQDGIVVCTNAGCVELVVGEAVRVTNSNSMPQRTAERSNVPPLVVRQDLFEPENPLFVPFILPEQTLVNGVLSGVSAMFAFGEGFLDSYPRGGEDPSDGVGTFVDGQMVKHVGTAGQGRLVALAGNGFGPQTVEKTTAEAGTFGTVGTADDPAFAGWGFWNGGRITYDGNGQQVLDAEVASYDFQGVHYIVGRPVPMAQMPITGTASYALIGGTAPTAFDGDTLRVGVLTGAGLNVDFSASRVNAFFNTAFMSGGTTIPVQISGYGYVEGTTFYSDVYGNGLYYGDSSGYYYGFFIGNQAARAGMVYGGYDDAVGNVRGAAVFLKTGSGLAFTEQAGMSAMFVSTDEYLYDFYPRGQIDPSYGIGYFVGNQLYLHDDGEDSYDGYGYGGTSTYLSTSGAVSSFGSIGSPGDADFIGWGYWTKGSISGNQDERSVAGVHYLVGRPTPSDQMPSNGTATYSMVGGTVPTATNGGTTIMGRLLGATMNVDFTNSSASATISTDFQKNGATVPVAIQETNIYIGGAWLCGNNVRGFFTGDQATRAGLVYNKTTGTDLGTVSGAVGLQRGAITPGTGN